MSSNHKKKKLAFTGVEVKKFYAETRSLYLRVNSLLSDHYSGINTLDDTSFRCALELILDSKTFEAFLDSLFAPINRKTYYEIEVENILKLSKLTLMMGNSRMELLKGNISLEIQ